MQETGKMYWEHPYLKELDSQVIDIKQHDKQLAVIVDNTIFYPEGGGQPGDRGWIGPYRITDTQYGPEGSILHILEEGQIPAIGAAYRMKIDWDHRYDFMQQHTAQHLISGIMYSQEAIGTLSVHFGNDEFTIEIDTDEIVDRTLYAIEDTVNHIIRTNIPVTSETRSLEEAGSMGLRREIKVDNAVRLIRIGSHDLIACGGIHVASTGELFHVMCIGTEKIRGHVRTQWLAGSRCVSVFRQNHSIIKQLCAAFSAPSRHLVGCATSLQTQLSDIQYTLRNCQTACATMILEHQITRAEYVDQTPIVVLDISDRDPDFMKRLAEAANSIDSIALSVLQHRDDGKLAWMIIIKGAISDRFDFTLLKNELLPSISAKGGGRPPMWQGVGTAHISNEAFFRKFIELLKNQRNISG
ncbi:MAG: alanyl-tRNA editing protein [Sphaerochaetaceae bacterium]|jgi:alanyl-tRNA synthetase|nr:alanyl-tRNA editing protein [Sphaerochaetaceae bacterium]NLO61111.1 alanyl-tRNA editing protein [Spirochaetales bacterium]MDD2405086.1 alanyl-tRNA editing protein [Sphaerochaetaceae bacterium]MDD3670903.1 alanyl-tRNA editing protein [Sphaerochaetaceae bacterium]MDD4259554.1 alanyl-tRNA editing protein [Sphaerochaetaceae bacterium]